MPAHPEAADQTPQRQGHSIYIRFIRIRYHINSHVPVPWAEWLPQTRCGRKRNRHKHPVMLAAPAESTAAPEQFRHGLPVFPVRVRIMSPLFLSGHLPKLRITAKKETAHWISNALNPCEFICAFQIRSQSNFLRKKDFHRIEKEKNHNASWKKQSPILILSIDNKINKETPIPFFADMRIWNPPQCMHMGYTKRKWMNIQKDF